MAKEIFNLGTYAAEVRNQVYTAERQWHEWKSYNEAHKPVSFDKFKEERNYDKRN